VILYNPSALNLRIEREAPANAIAEQEPPHIVDVCYWPLADVPRPGFFVRFRGWSSMSGAEATASGRHTLIARGLVIWRAQKNAGRLEACPRIW